MENAERASYRSQEIVSPLAAVRPTDDNQKREWCESLREQMAMKETVIACLALFAVLASTVVADDEVAPKKKLQPVSEAQAAELGKWVQALTSDDFKTRVDAARQLVASGVAAVEPVAEAADGDDLERTTRCLVVLKKLLKSSTPGVTLAARQALVRLSKSVRRSVAVRAAAALPRPTTTGSRKGARQRVGRPAVVGNATRISVRTINGKRTIEVKTGTRKVLIEDAGGKQITVRVTDLVNGKPLTTEYKGADAAELKKKHPEGHKLYEKYTKNNRIIIRQGFPFGKVRPNFPGFPRQMVRPVNPNVRNQVGLARKRIDVAVSRLKELAGKPTVTPAELQGVLKELAAAQQALQRAIGPVVPRKPVPPKRPAPKKKTKKKDVVTQVGCDARRRIA